jgi:membrane fusion protein (multidrug efflux system)
MTKRMRTMAISLAIVFGGLFAFNIIKTLLIKHFLGNYRPPAVSVSSVVALEQNWNPVLKTVGDFTAMSGVDLNTEASGKIISIDFTSGQFILKDAPILSLDDTVEKASLQFYQAELTLQQINFQRQLDLQKRGATPSSTVDAARAKLLQAQANVTKTEAEINLKHLKAPFSGRLGINKISLGEYVTAGQTKIVSLQSMDPLYLRFYLPEQQVNLLTINQKITFTVEQSPNLIFEAHITAINSKVDTNMHNIEVQALVFNCPAITSPKAASASHLVKLTKSPLHTKPIAVCDTNINTRNKVSQFNFIPGMFAAINIEQPTIGKAIVLPTTAISYSLYGNSVFIIEKESSSEDKNKQENLVVRRVFIKTGDQKGNYTVIKSGLKAGQLVVAAGELKLENGTSVIINNEVTLTNSENISQIGQ